MSASNTPSIPNAAGIRERADCVRRYIAHGPREGKQQAIAALEELTLLASQVGPLDKALRVERSLQSEGDKPELFGFWSNQTLDAK